MSIHFFHTADWHLGQLFYHYTREYEHQCFLDWLLQQIQLHQPDALLIAGDIFDVINPSAQAQKQLYQFLADAHAIHPTMQTIMIAGNHDSGYRIEQVSPLLDKFNVKTVGTIEWIYTNADQNHKKEKTLNKDKLILPIYKQNQIIAWVVALPYLRSAEITGFNAETQDFHDALSYIHHDLIQTAKQKCTNEQSLIIMSHAHLQGGETSDSERPIVIGNEEALSVKLFGTEIDYVALGHLHKPQKVQYDYIRYSGSPIPLSLTEANYKHQILNVHLDKSNHTTQIEPIYIPRTVNILRLKGSIENIITQLNQLPESIRPLEKRDYIDIEYFTDTPPPLDLRQQFENALAKDSYRLLKIQRQIITKNSSTESTQKIALKPPTPQDLFQQLWLQQGYAIDKQAEQDFLTILDESTQLLQQQKEKSTV